MNGRARGEVVWHCPKCLRTASFERERDSIRACLRGEDGVNHEVLIRHAESLDRA